MKSDLATGAPICSSRRTFLKRALFAVPVLGGSGAYYARNIEPEALGVTRVNIRIPGWQHPAVTVGHAADMHCLSKRSLDRTRRAAHLLRAQNPDIIFLTGDYISTRPDVWSALAADALAPLVGARLGSYAVLGNHDWTSGDPDKVADDLHRVGFTVLRNESVPLPSMPDVWVVGMDDRSEHKHDATLALRNVPEHAIKLLLIHEPDYADEAPDGIALQFSGHSHGGQVRIPGFPPLHEPRFAKKYPEGLQNTLKHRVFTTRGVGMTGRLQVRFCCPPEVAVLRLS